MNYRSPCSAFKWRIPSEKEKRNESASEAVKGRLAVFSSSFIDDCCHELLADDQCVYHFTENRFQCKHEMVRTDFLQLYQNVFGPVVPAFCRKYISLSGNSGTDHAGTCNSVGTVTE